MPATSVPLLDEARAATTISGIETALLDAKRSAPRSRPGLVRRPRLLRRLLESTDIPLVLVVAPAGFGKTSLISEWAERDPRPFAWVRLDEGDNDVRRLVTSIAHALDRCRALSRLSRAAVLVIDDLHVISDQEALAALGTIVDRLPAGSQLALASRTQPALPVGRLRAHCEVLEVSSSDLVMTRLEAGALLRMAGLDLDPDQVANLVSQTEGWPVGLYLAAVALREQRDAGHALPGFDGGDRIVADYLRDEVMSQIPRAQLDFLLRTSVLDELSGPLCDAVLERRDSARTLVELARSNLLVVPLDRRQEWFRYHLLLAAALRAELRRHEPERERKLHRRASAWYAGHDDPDRAIGHAIEARDAYRAGQLMWRDVARRAPRGRHERIERWLAHFSEEEVARVPALALVAAAAQLTSGDGNRLRHWASAAARSLDEERPPGGEAPLEAGVAVMRAAVGGAGLEAMREDAAHAYELERADSPRRSICCLLEGVALHLGGEPEPARVLLEEGARRGAVGSPTTHTLCLAQLGLLALDDGDPYRAQALAGRAMGQVERFGVGEHPTEVLVFALSADVRAMCGQAEDASRDLRQALRLLSMLTDFIPWYEAEVRVVMARAAVRLSDAPTARRLLGEASHFLRKVPDAAVLQAWHLDVCAQANASSDSGLGRGRALTAAELRVLHYLPSHLSFPDIAERLYVSPNTVKTHARAVYRKLDASSRAEAVAHARDGGLLGATITA